MKTPIISAVLSLIIALGVEAGVTPIYQNFGSVDSPQVDATVFANYGVLTYGQTTISGFLPFTTRDTYYYTNTGSMSGSDGFRFDLETTNGRGPATTFFNSGIIGASSIGLTSFSLSTTFAVGAFNAIYAGYGSYILINADTIKSSGNLTVDAAGVMQIQGNNVTLARSGLRTGPAPSQSSSSGFFFGSTFGELAPLQIYNDASQVTDIYGGIGTNATFSGNGPLLNLSNLFPPRSRTPRFQVLENGFTNTASLGGSSMAAFAYTNIIDSSNFVVQVFFLNTNNSSGDSHFLVDGGFVNNPNASTQIGKIAVARFSVWDVDALTQLPFTNSVFFLDDLATITNAIYLTNSAFFGFVGNGAPVRPSNMAVTWGAPPEYVSVSPGNTVYTNSLLYTTNSAQASVTNVYSAYSASVSESPGNSLAAGSILGVGTDPTNLPARIEITAQNLDVTALRVRSIGPVTIKANNLTNGGPSRIDSQWINLNLGSTGAPLTVTNFVPQQIRRMSGTVAGWAATWTNYINQIVGAGTNATTNVLTGVYYATIVDQSFSTLNSGSALHLALHSTTADIQDNPINITEGLLLDVTNLTVSGALVVAVQTNLDSSTCPKLQSLVIPSSGSISLGGSANSFFFGFSAAGSVSLGYGSTVLTNFSNLGTRVNNSGLSGINADSIRIKSTALANSGVLTAGAGIIELRAALGKLDSGSSISAQGNVNIFGSEWKAQNSTLQAGGAYTDPLTGLNTTFPGALNIAVTNYLNGTGPAGLNTWTTYGGFNLVVLPQAGDMWGTLITTIAADFTEVDHTWAGADYGPNVAGYTNNAALGQLTLQGGNQSFFVFSGTGTANAMYVTNLTFSGQATNLAAELQINPNLTIYFADSNLKPQVLTNFSSQLVYLPIPGVNGVPLPIVTPPPPTVQPTTGIQLLNGGSFTPAISWTALPNAAYQVQFTTDLLGTWQTIYSTTNNSGISQPLQLNDGGATGIPIGFYRVQQIAP